MKFTKIHALGNDYIYVDFNEKIPNDPARWSIFLSHRRFGVGADGLVTIERSDVADFKMRIFNADGSEAQMCGNALRSVGKYVFVKGYITKKNFAIETLSGIKKIFINDDDGFVVEADIGKPIFEMPQDQCTCILKDHPYSVGEVILNLNSVSVGNPHCVVFVDDVDSFDVEKYGPIIENCEFFPNRTNVEFVEIINKNTIKMRVWERGSNETWACGTGCAAATAISIMHGFCDRNVKVLQKGGELDVELTENDNTIIIKSDAHIVFSGETNSQALENFERISKYEIK